MYNSKNYVPVNGFHFILGEIFLGLALPQNARVIGRSIQDLLNFQIFIKFSNFQPKKRGIVIFYSGIGNLKTRNALTNTVS